MEESYVAKRSIFLEKNKITNNKQPDISVC